MNNEFTIRRAVPGDEEALALLGRATFLEAFAGVLQGPDILTHCRVQHAESKYRHWLESGESAVYLAEETFGHAPIGYSVLTTPDLPLPDLDASDIELKRIYVLHRYQGTGLGPALMAKAIEESRARGMRRLLLGVYAENHRALAFYKKSGFEIIGTRTFQVGQMVCDDYVLGRIL